MIRESGNLETIWQTCDLAWKLRSRNLQSFPTGGLAGISTSRCRPDLLGLNRTSTLVPKLHCRLGMEPQDLRKRLAAFAAAVERFSRPLLHKVETGDAAIQLRRSSTGAASNHRAAGRGRSHAEFTAKLSVALEEADESLFWLEHLVGCGLAPEQQLNKLIPESKELVAILTASVRTARGGRSIPRFPGHRRSITIPDSQIPDFRLTSRPRPTFDNMPSSEA